MKYLLSILFFLSVLFMISCEKQTNITTVPPPSLLHKVFLQGELITELYYDSENRLSREVTGNGNSIIDYFYNTNGDFTGFKQVVTNNPIFPIRRFDVEVNTATRIEGTMKLYGPNDAEDPNQRQYYVYEIQNDLLKSVYYRDVQSGEINLEKYFYHNDDGNLNYYQFKKEAGFNNVAKLVAKDWDSELSPSIYTTNMSYINFYKLPGLKISHNNIKSFETFSGGGASWGLKTDLLEYNSGGQLTRRYVETSPYEQENEDGTITIIYPQEDEITSYTYEYIEGE